MGDKIKVGIIGATGYAGGELVRLLFSHGGAEIVWLASKSYAGQPYASIYENMFQLVDLDCIADDLAALSETVDVIFTATPQGYLAGLLTDEILQKVKVIDLSADYRIKDVATYEKWYKIEHKSPDLIEGAVYGLSEIPHRIVASDIAWTVAAVYAFGILASLIPALVAAFKDPVKALNE